MQFSGWTVLKLLIFTRIESINRSSRRAIVLKYLFLFSGSDYFKEISRTPLIFQEKIILIQEHIKFSRRTKNSTRTHVNFSGEAKYIKTHQNFHRRAFSKFHKNTYDLPGGKNIIRTDEFFQEILSKISLGH